MELGLYRALLRSIGARIGSVLQRSFVLSSKKKEKRTSYKVKVVGGKVIEEIELIQPFGLFGVAPAKGSAAIVGQMEGQDKLYYLLAVDNDSKRPLAKEGESGLFNDAGIVFKLGMDGIVRISGATGFVVEGEVSDSKGSLDELRSAFMGHIHNDSDGDPTGPQISGGA